MDPNANPFVPKEKKARLADEQIRYRKSMFDLEQGNDEELRRAGEEYRFDKEKVRQAFHKPEMMRLYRNFMQGNDEELRRAGERGEEEYKKKEALTKHAFENAMGGKKRKTKKHKKGMKKRKTRRGKKTGSKSMRKRK
jgi:hypothetical protein